MPKSPEQIAKLHAGRQAAHKRRQQLEAEYEEFRKFQLQQNPDAPAPTLKQFEKAKKVSPDNQAKRRQAYREKQLLAAYKSTRASKAPVVGEVLEEVCRMLGKRRLAQLIVEGIQSDNPVEARTYTKIILDYVRVHTKEINAAKDEDVDDLTEQQIDAIVELEYGIKRKYVGDDEENLDATLSGTGPDGGGCAEAEEADGAEGETPDVAAGPLRTDSESEAVPYVASPGAVGPGGESRGEDDLLRDGSGMGGDGDASLD